MQISRTITIATTYKDIVAALKAQSPTNLHLQSIPDDLKAGVGVEISSGKGLIISYNTALKPEAEVVQLGLAGPVGG